MDKYKWRFRILLITTPDKKNIKFINTVNKFNENKKKFHKMCVKLITKLDKNFSIKLIGFDGQIKYIYNDINTDKVVNQIKKMPMGNKPCPVKLSLYEDYNPKTTIQGLGFKDKEKAIYTINKIKNEPLKYQKSVISTMIGRAKNHPYQTKEMREAIKIFKDWLKKNKSI